MSYPFTRCVHAVPWSHARAGAGLALGLLGALTGAPAHADWEIGTTLGALYDDNLTRAQDAVDKRAAGAAVANVSGSQFIPFSGGDSVMFTLYGRGELFARYGGLSNLVGGGTAAWRHKFGMGYAAPWVSLAVGASYDDYRDDLRTSTRLDVRAETGMRYGEQLDASAGVYWERRYDNHGESIVPGISGTVFDLAGQGAFVRAGYAPADEWYVGVKAGVRRGDVESTSQRSLQVFLASSAITDDPVWGDPELYAYRLRGTTYSGDLAASYALSHRTTLDLVYRYGFTRAAQGLEYATNAIDLTFVHRF